MASVAWGNETLVDDLKRRGDPLSLSAAKEIERLLRIWEYNNSMVPEDRGRSRDERVGRVDLGHLVHPNNRVK